MNDRRWIVSATGLAVFVSLVAVMALPARPAAVQGGTLAIAWPADEEPANLDSQVDPYDSTSFTVLSSMTLTAVTALISALRFDPGNFRCRSMLYLTAAALNGVPS